MSRYSPSQLPQSMQDLARVLEDEHRKIQATLDYLMNGNKEIRTAEPERPSEGMVVFADGTGWNPGHGKGLYEYKDSDWVPLFPFDPQAIIARHTVDGDAAADGTTETTIYTLTIPADTLHIGEVYRTTLSGSYAIAGSSTTWTMRFKINGTTLHTITRLTGGSGGAGHDWKAEIVGTIRTNGASGSVITNVTHFDDNKIETSSDTAATTIDTTVDRTMTVTLQWGAASASNLFYTDQGFTEYLH